MICQKCGWENPEGSIFCNKCGAELYDEDKSSTPESEQREEQQKKR